jgi:putative serine protease PepD
MEIVNADDPTAPGVAAPPVAQPAERRPPPPPPPPPPSGRFPGSDTAPGPRPDSGDGLFVQQTPPWGHRPQGPPVVGAPGGPASGPTPVVPGTAGPGGAAAPARPPGPFGPHPGAPAPAPAPDRSGTGRRMGWAIVVGVLVGALVAAGVSVAVIGLADDDGDEPAAAITTPEGSMDVQAILQEVQESVVTIETSGLEQGALFGGAGTGVVLSDDGLVLTNAHVLGGSGGGVQLDGISVRMFDGSTHDATLVGSATSNDLAVIRVEGVDDLTPATLGSSDSLDVGEPVIAIGNALNLGGQPTVTTGIVSALNRSITAGDGTTLTDLVQTDAAINPGNSGGPLVDSSGEVVGVNTAILQDTQNIGFSIAIDSVRTIIEDLEQGNGEVTPDTPLLGVSTISLDTVEDAVTSQFNISADQGAFVVQVEPGTGADEAGLRQGDVIVEVDGEPITSSEELGETVRSAEVGDELEITIEREGEEQTVTAELGRQGG